jgi:hypothetical protein
MKNRIVRFAVVILAALMTFSASCGGSEGEKETGKEPVLALSLQSRILTKGDDNAFVVELEDAGEAPELIYQMQEDGSETWSEYRKTTAAIVVYKCTVAGSFSVRVQLTRDGKDYFSNTEAFTVENEGGQSFGASPGGDMPSGNVDFSGDRGETPVLTHRALSKVSDEYAYYKNIGANQFVMTAKIDIRGINGSDPYPKAGFFAKVGTTYYLIVFDARTDYNYDDVVFVSGSAGSWGWPGTIFKSGVSFRQGAQRVVNELTMIRDAQDFYFLINGNFLGQARVNGLTAASVIGTYTMAQHTVYSEYVAYDGSDSRYAGALADAMVQKNAVSGENFGASPLGETAGANVDFV